MRKIKFRAWDAENKEMRYDIESIEFDSERATNVYFRDDTSMFVHKEGYIQYPTCELMQFTGLHDKNGKEIYEGDMLQDSKYSYWVVRWSDSGWICDQYVFSKDDNEEYTWKRSTAYPLGYSLTGLLTYSYKVIGSIYENKNETL